jgi:hypothetical protein
MPGRAIEPTAALLDRSVAAAFRHQRIADTFSVVSGA